MKKLKKSTYATIFLLSILLLQPGCKKENLPPEEKPPSYSKNVIMRLLKIQSFLGCLSGFGYCTSEPMDKNLWDLYPIQTNEAKSQVWASMNSSGLLNINYNIGQINLSDNMYDALMVQKKFLVSENIYLSRDFVSTLCSDAGLSDPGSQLIIPTGTYPVLLKGKLRRWLEGVKAKLTAAFNTRTGEVSLSLEFSF